MTTRATQVKRRYTPYWRISDPKRGNDWVGLTKRVREYQTIDLVPGEYKLQLSLPAGLNSNKLISSLPSNLPNLWLDADIVVLSKVQNHATGTSDGGTLFNLKCIMDLVDHNELEEVFRVGEGDLPCTLTVDFKSHSLFKRLKLQGVLWRRDLMNRDRTHNSRMVGHKPPAAAATVATRTAARQSIGHKPPAAATVATRTAARQSIGHKPPAAATVATRAASPIVAQKLTTPATVATRTAARQSIGHKPPTPATVATGAAAPQSKGHKPLTTGTAAARTASSIVAQKPAAITSTSGQSTHEQNTYMAHVPVEASSNATHTESSRRASLGRSLLMTAFSSSSSSTLDHSSPRQVGTKGGDDFVEGELFRAKPKYPKLALELGEFYRVYAPEKIGDIPMLLQVFKDREEDLVASVRAKYGEPFIPTEN